MAVTASLRGNAARGFKIFKTSVFLVPIASSLASRRYHRAVDTEDNHHRLFHRSRHRTPTRARRPRRRASRVSPASSNPIVLSQPARGRSSRSIARARRRSRRRSTSHRARDAFVRFHVHERASPLIDAFPRLVPRARHRSRLARRRPRGLARARRRRIHPIDSTGDAREGRRRPIHETTAGRIKNTPVASIDPNARSPRPHRSTRRLSSSSCARARSRRCHARASNTYRDGAKPLTAPNCARATPVAARRAVVAALAETTTRDGAAIVVIITATREGSREDVTSRDGLARARAR